MKNLKFTVGTLPHLPRVDVDGELAGCITEIRIKATRSAAATVQITTMNRDAKTPVAEFDGALYSHEEHRQLEEILSILDDYARLTSEPAFEGVPALIESLRGKRTTVQHIARPIRRT